MDAVKAELAGSMLHSRHGVGVGGGGPGGRCDLPPRHVLFAEKVKARIVRT